MTLLDIEPPLALLRQRRCSRVFQDKDVPEILKTIFDEYMATHPVFIKSFSYRFDLTPYIQHPPRSYCVQYREDDYHFIQRLCAEEGLQFRFEHQGGDTEARVETQAAPIITFIAFDDPWKLPQATQGEVRFHRANATERSDSLTVWRSQRQIGPGCVALLSFDYKLAVSDRGAEFTHYNQGAGKQIEAALEDYDHPGHYYAKPGNADLYRYIKLRQRAYDGYKKSFLGRGTVRELEAGQWFQLTEHPGLRYRKVGDTEFVVTSLRFRATNNLPGGEKDQADQADQDRPPYLMEIQAQRRGLPIPPRYAHTPLAKPTAPGPQTATVVGPRGEEEVYTDGMGRIKIEFHWQRKKNHPEYGANEDERSSCWVRVVTPYAGAGWGHQFIPRIGQEVEVEFIEGDIDRPVVMGVVHNGRHVPPYFSNAGKLPANRALSGVRTKEHYGYKYNELVFDDTTGQVRAKLSTEHGKSQLNQGYLTHPRLQGEAEPRGDGFELRTDLHGALRAAEGMLLSTEAKSEASGKQLDRENAQAMLDSSRKLAEDFSNIAKGQKTDPTELGPETLNEEGASEGKSEMGNLDHLVEASRAWEDGTNTSGKNAKAGGGGNQPGKQGVLLVSAQDGMGWVTPEEMALVAEGNLHTISHRDTQQTTVRRWIHNAESKISLFVQGEAGELNLKVITGQGHARIWTQYGDVEIVGDQNVSIHANTGKLHFIAEEELLGTAAGAYFRLKGGVIDIHAPGKLTMKAASFQLSGPASMKKKDKSPEPKSCGGSETMTRSGAGSVALD